MQDERSCRTRTHAARAAAAFALVGVLVMGASPPGAVAEELARATTLAGAVESEAGQQVFQTSSAQLQKPHRLTWYAEGRWWAVLRKSAGEDSGWRVWRRDLDGSWVPGVQLSTVEVDRFDVFRNPDDGRVFVHQLRPIDSSRLLRLRYDAGQDMFVVAASADVPNSYLDGTVSLTVDTVGRVWIVTHPDGRLAYTVRDSETLGEIAPLTVLPDAVAPESLVAGRFVDDRGPAVGFVYAGPVAPYRGMFVVQRDADPVGTFSAEQFADGVDAHSTFAAAGSDLIVAWKQEGPVVGEPIVRVRRRFPDGSWSRSVPVFDATSSLDTENHTRPRVVVDADNRQVHVAASERTADAVEVHERVAPIDSLEFGAQRVLFRSGNPPHDGFVFRDVHAGQQPVTSASGLLWLARGREASREAGGFSLWQRMQDLPGPPHENWRPAVTRIAGANRFETAARIATASYPAGTATALLARGDDFADALAAAPLARQAAAPVLLTARRAVPAATLAALEALAADRVVIMGGPAAVGDEVVRQLTSVGYDVSRVAGSSRFATAAAIARAVDAAPGGAIGTVDGRRTAFLASGTSFPDALAAAAPAAAQDEPLPILLTTKDELAAEAAQALTDLDIEQVIIVGGSSVVGADVETAIRDSGVEVQRLSGPNRLATAARVADFMHTTWGTADGHVVLARGDDFPDALSAGPHAGRLGAPITLAATPTILGEESRIWLGGACNRLNSMLVIGGTGAVSDEVAAEAAATAGAACPWR